MSSTQAKNGNTNPKKRSLEEIVIEDPEKPTEEYISLTTHADEFQSKPITMDWGNAHPKLRGPVVATVKHGGQRNAIGAHGGNFYRFFNNSL